MSEHYFGPWPERVGTPDIGPDSSAEDIYQVASNYDRAGDVERASRYYRMAIEKRHPRAIYNLAVLYHVYERMESAEECYLTILATAPTDETLQDLEQLYEGNLVRLAHQLRKVSAPTLDSVIATRLAELSHDPRVIAMDARVSEATLRDTCTVCYEEDRLMIPRDCRHSFCHECSTKLSRCPLCEN